MLLVINLTPNRPTYHSKNSHCERRRKVSREKSKERKKVYNKLIKQKRIQEFRDMYTLCPVRNVFCLSNIYLTKDLSLKWFPTCFTKQTRYPIIKFS